MSDHFSPTNGSSSAGGGGGGEVVDDSASHSSPAFHTPEQQQQQQQQYSASSSKKRPASEFQQGSSDGSGASDNSGGGRWRRLVMSFTPWKRSSTSGTKRPRTSLDDMSGSAIKRLVNQTEEEDDDDGNGGEDYKDDNRNENKTLGEGGGGTSTCHGGEKNSGYVSDGVKTSGAKLGKLNLEAKFDGDGPTGGNQSQRRNMSLVGVPPPQQGGGGSRMRIQQLQPPEQQLHQQQSLVQGSSDTRSASASSEMPMKKRVRIHDEMASDAAVQSPYHHTTIGRMNDNANIPTFHTGINGGHPQQHKSPIPLRNVHGRKGTPAGKFAASSSASSMSMQQGHFSTAGSTPGLRKMGGTRFPSAVGAGSRPDEGPYRMGTTTSNYALSTTSSLQRRSTAAPKRSLLNYHHRSTNARSYKPMSHLLTGANSHHGISSTDGDESMMLTKSIVSQIVAENQNQLLLAASNAGGDSGRLFGGQNAVATTKRNARENVDTSGTNLGTAVPRVRMTRILGSGQTGGRWHVATEERQSAAPLPEYATDGTTAKLAKKRVATFQLTPGLTETSMEDVSETAPTDGEPTLFVPYNAVILTPRVTKSGKQLTPCKCELSMEEGLEIERWINSEEFKQEAKFNRLGFDDPAIYNPSMSTSPRKKGKRQCTPYPKKKIVDALAMSTPVIQRADEEITAKSVPNETVPTFAGAPFNFMSGGAAASSVVNTPMAFKFLDKKSAPAPSLPETSSAPPVKESPAQGERATHQPNTTPSGWGNLFPPTPGFWKCACCSSTQNLEGASHCTSCQTAREPRDNSGTGTTGKNNEPAVNAVAGSIGAGGFTFGGKPSLSAEPASSAVVATVSNPFTPNINSNSKAVPSISGSLDDLFKLKSGEWKCGRCACRNSASDSKCGDCGTSREGGEDKKTSGGIDGAASVIPKSSHGAETETAIGAGGFSFAGSTFSNTSGSINSGGFSFGGATANPTSATPAKPKRVRLEASEDDSSSRTPVAGFNLGGAPSSPTSNTKPAHSVGFTFGATATPLVDEKKEDPVTSAKASNAGAFFGAAAEKRNTIAPTSTFSFGLAPQPNRLATDTIANKDEASVPSNKKAMLSFAKGSETSSTAEHRVSFLATTAMKENSTPSTQPTLLFGNMTASTKPADAPAPPAATGSESSTTTAFSFGEKVKDSTAAPAPTSLFSFGAPAATAGKNNDAPALLGQTSSSFGSTPSVAPIPSTQNNGANSAAPFLFGGPAPAAPPTGGSTFTFSSGTPTTSTPAQSNTSIPASTAGSLFGAASNTSTFGTMSGGFGSTSQSAAPAPAPTKPGTTFSFGIGSTPTPAAGGFGTTPVTFGFGSAPTQPMAQTPTTGTFGMNVASNPTPGFSGNQIFGVQSTAMGGFTPQLSSGGGGGGGGVGSFSIGIGDAKGAGGGTRGTGSAVSTKRRIVKAKRPQK